MNERRRLQVEVATTQRMAYPCRCKSCRSPCGSWCASSCHQTGQRSSCRPPSCQKQEPCQPGPCQRWWGSERRVRSNALPNAPEIAKYLGCGGLGRHFEVGFLKWWKVLDEFRRDLSMDTGQMDVLRQRWDEERREETRLEERGAVGLCSERRKRALPLSKSRFTRECCLERHGGTSVASQSGLAPTRL